MARAPGERRAGRRAVTLVEMLIGLMITSMIALGVASILHAASYGTSSRREVRRLVVRVQQTRRRINDLIRDSRGLLASGAGYLVLSNDYTCHEQSPYLKAFDVVALTDDPAVLTHFAVTCPTAWTSEQVRDAGLDGLDFSSVGTNAKAGSAALSAGLPAGLLVTEHPWSASASGLTSTPDHASPAMATLVTWQMTLTSDLVSEPMVGAASPRERGAPQCP